MTEGLLFKVIANGHEYEIYTDGTVKGFGENAIVFNNYHTLIRVVRKNQHDQQRAPLRSASVVNT